MSKAMQDVLAERERQQAVEGWTTDHDDEHDCGELALAAACYAFGSTLPTDARIAHYRAQGMLKYGLYSAFMMMWPSGWGPIKIKTPRKDLVRAGALILAEIERLDRAEARHLVRFVEE